MKTKAVRSQRIAWLLRKEGFKILASRQIEDVQIWMFIYLKQHRSYAQLLIHTSRIKTTKEITNESKSEEKS
mgnify:FL=1